MERRIPTGLTGRNICPLLSSGGGQAVDCLEENCAWFCLGGCALVCLAAAAESMNEAGG